jgi:hypothetical protein
LLLSIAGALVLARPWSLVPGNAGAAAAGGGGMVLDAQHRGTSALGS